MDTLIELKFLNSRFSSSNLYILVFRVCPLVEVRQTVPCPAIRGNSSNSSRQYLSQQYTPSSLMIIISIIMMIIVNIIIMIMMIIMIMIIIMKIIMKIIMMIIMITWMYD